MSCLEIRMDGYQEGEGNYTLGYVCIGSQEPVLVEKL